ncbi:molybdopterin-dependent oxidoreductase [Aquicoccus sp. SCR17]|nr:molybdopterin-dependent oxidoreductase [Carideicomes alvinocaridis]
MEKFGKSQPVNRVEDVRFLTGHGRYMEDVAPDGALHAFFLRAPVAHATITTLDVTEAREAPGVAAVLTAADLEAAGVAMHIGATVLKNRDGNRAAEPQRPPLAVDRLRFVGEPVAIVVAETLDQAKDAAELIELDYEDLEPQMELEPGEVAIHDEAPDNRAFDWALGDEAATEAAFARAAHVVELDVDDHRVIVNSMEPRGCHAEWQDGKLTLAFGGQGVWGIKDRLIKAFGLDEDKVQVLNPDVGGGFGMKAGPYPEYWAIAQAARVAERPVRWISDRTEAMLTDNGGRDVYHRAALAFDADHRLLGYRVHSRSNMGAYLSQFAQMIQSNLFARVLTGCYDVQDTFLHVEGFYTNTTPVDAYRGAGRPEAIYLLERLMDRAARELGEDPFELRRKNFITDFPYKTSTGETYDVGEFGRVMDHGASLADVPGFAARREESRKKGRLRGLGLCYYIESILGDPSEGAKVEFNADGTVSIYVGTQSNGQGHETVYAQFLADQTGIPASKIDVVQGDSDRIAQGGGTGGSRSVTTQANATLATVAMMTEAFLPYLAEKMGVEEADITFDDETFRAPGSNLSPTFLEAAEMARADGREDLLRHEARAKLPGRSYPNGAHIAEVEIDPETGVVTLERYTVCDDFGNLINPKLAAGQVHGGVAQGVGQALSESAVYDEDGQLLTATFMDYAMPRSFDLPMIELEFDPVPSTANPMGMKGCGEAGTVGSMAAVSNAVQDALWEQGVRQADMPFTPLRVWEMLQGNAVEAA